MTEEKSKNGDDYGADSIKVLKGLDAVRNAFGPLFERYGVQLVLAGHDHDYQRSQQISGVTYVVSGGAATLRGTERAEFTEVAWSTYHFVDIAVWSNRMELRAINQHGAVFDTFELEP